MIRHLEDAVNYGKGSDIRGIWDIATSHSHPEKAPIGNPAF